jgi:hypothetical protein
MPVLRLEQEDDHLLAAEFQASTPKLPPPTPVATPFVTT